MLKKQFQSKKFSTPNLTWIVSYVNLDEVIWIDLMLCKFTVYSPALCIVENNIIRKTLQSSKFIPEKWLFRKHLSREKISANLKHMHTWIHKNNRNKKNITSL